MLWCTHQKDYWKRTEKKNMLTLADLLYSAITFVLIERKCNKCLARLLDFYYFAQYFYAIHVHVLRTQYWHCADGTNNFLIVCLFIGFLVFIVLPSFSFFRSLDFFFDRSHREFQFSCSRSSLPPFQQPYFWSIGVWCHTQNICVTHSPCVIWRLYKPFYICIIEGKTAHKKKIADACAFYFKFVL